MGDEYPTGTRHSKIVYAMRHLHFPKTMTVKSKFDQQVTVEEEYLKSELKKKAALERKPRINVRRPKIDAPPAPKTSPWSSFRTLGRNSKKPDDSHPQSADHMSIAHNSSAQSYFVGSQMSVGITSETKPGNEQVVPSNAPPPSGSLPSISKGAPEMTTQPSNTKTVPRQGRPRMAAVLLPDVKSRPKFPSLKRPGRKDGVVRGRGNK